MAKKLTFTGFVKDMNRIANALEKAQKAQERAEAARIREEMAKERTAQAMKREKEREEARKAREALEEEKRLYRQMVEEDKKQRSIGANYTFRAVASHEEVDAIFQSAQKKSAKMQAEVLSKYSSEEGV